MISQQQQGGTTVMAWNAHITFKDGPENCFWDPHIQDGVLWARVQDIYSLFKNGLEQDCIMTVIVWDIHNTSINGLEQYYLMVVIV